MQSELTNRIYRLKPGQVGKPNWNAAIDACSSPLPYVRWHHLDAVTGATAISRGWEIWADAPTMQEASWFMPLPFRARGLYRAITQPLFTQQLGVMFKPGVRDADQAIILQQIIKRLLATPLTVVYAFNGANTRILETHAPETLQQLGGLVELAPNYVVDLLQPYQVIRSAYAPNLEKKLRRRYGHHYAYSQTRDDAMVVVELFEHYINNVKHILAERHMGLLKRMVDSWLKEGQLVTTLAHDDADNLLAGLIYLREDHWPQGTRYSCVMGGATALGKKHDSQMKLMDHNIMTWQAEGAALFDFEGSRIPGIRKVFSTYGGQFEQYLVLRKGWGRISY